MDNKLRILLVEDDEDDFLLTSEMLAESSLQNFLLDRSKSYAEALVQIESSEYDIALLDFSLGSYTGLELLQAIKSIDSQLPIVMLTGQDDYETDMAAMEAGASDYLLKSELSPGLLSRTIRYAAEHQRMRDQLTEYADLAVRKEQQLHAIIEESPAGFLVVDADHKVVYANQSAKDLLAYEHPQLIGKRIAAITRAKELEIKSTKTRSIVLEAKRNPVDWGNQDATLVTLIDVTQRKRMEQRLEQQANFDSLTGLANRAHFYHHLKRIMATALRGNSILALLYLDLDHFKEINDSMGHDAGDALLIQVAQRLEENMRSEDMIARLGGDEFAIVLHNLSDYQQAGRIAQKIINIFETPYVIKQKPLRMHTSIGITTYPQDQLSRKPDPEALVKQADSAMYQAKHNGRGNYQYFSKDMQEVAVMRSIMEFDLSHALEDEEFLLFYQPIINAESQLLAVEVFLRWQHVRRGLLTSADFIKAAESSPHLADIADWIFDAACTQFYQWQQDSLIPKGTRLCVNTSTRHLIDSGFGEGLLERLNHIGLQANDLELEFSEKALCDDLEIAGSQLEKLAKTGISISLDDFGTGSIAISELCKLPLKRLKIDRSRIAHLAYNEPDQAFIQAAVDLGTHLQFEVVAEGVEHEQEIKQLKEYGCYIFQGFYFARPMSGDKFRIWLQDLKTDANPFEKKVTAL